MNVPAREIAVAILRRGDEILVSDVPDPVKGLTGWRPPGGGVERGERPEDTVMRELREELAVEVAGPRALAVIDNRFVYLGRRHREIVHVFAVTFADPALYARERFSCVEGAQPFTCAWRDLSSFGASAPLYPEGLSALLVRSPV